MSQLPKFGWKKERPDFRDFHFGATAEAITMVDPPHVFDLRDSYPDLLNRVKNQMNQDCVYNAGCLALELLQLELYEQMKRNPFQFGLSVETISRRFLYYVGREIDGTLGEDEGSYLRTFVLAVRNKGMCRETIWPYLETNLDAKPSEAAFQEANQHQVLTGYRVDHQNIEEIKKSICQGYPVIGGFTLYDSFMETVQDGKIKHPAQSESIQGGHAMCIVGYNDDTQYLVLANSWGKTWGDHGFCYLPYDYATNRYLAADFWSLRLTSNSRKGF